MIDRRAEPRWLCSDLIEIRIARGADDPETVVANLEEISPSGACVLFAQPLPPGTHVSLKLGRFRFRGRVQYTTWEPAGHYSGIRFDAGRKWSLEIYRPQHLLDPAKLMNHAPGRTPTTTRLPAAVSSHKRKPPRKA